MPDIFHTVRTSCRTVAENATWVTIDTAKIPAYAAALPLNEITNPDLDAESHYLDQGEDTLAFFLILDAINFGSGYFPHLKKLPGKSGYFTVAGNLNRYFKEQGPLTAETLKSMTAERCMTIFRQDTENQVVGELMKLFSQALKDLGSLLLDRYQGRFSRLIEDAGQSAEKLVAVLRQMPFFNDSQTYKSQTVHFYKRAQLTAADLALAFHNEEYGRFNDLDRLTIFADNLVPHVLRIDTILQYRPELEQAIDNGELIEPGSEQEIEIRASALHAVELMVSELNATHPGITSMGLDYLLWNRGQQRYYKQIKPRHRARTVYY